MAKIINSSGVMKALLITPGQGSTGYYSEGLLQKIPSKFDGAQVYWDHPTSSEESSRPERSLRDLAGKILPGSCKWESDGTNGAGIYGDVQVYKPYQEAVNELGPDIGMSIRARGKGKESLVNGKKTMVIESIDSVASVDFVTLPGRGGKPLQLFEAARAAGRAACLTEIGSLEAGAKCPDCKGTGDCAKCNGTGKVLKTSEAKTKGTPKAMVDCGDCDGTGDCSACEGDGKVMESAARTAAKQGEKGDMDEAQIKSIVESAVKAAVEPLTVKLTEAQTKLTTKVAEAEAKSAPLLQRALRGDAREHATAVLKGVTLSASAKEYVVNECLKTIPLKDGELDKVVFAEAINAKAKEIAMFAGDGGRVIGMGITAPVPIDAKEAAQRKADEQAVRESETDIFLRLTGGNKEAAAAAVNKGVAA